MRRYVLGPVIMCLLVIGLVGVDYGQVARAHSNSKKETKSVASKETKTPKKIADKTQEATATKKVSSAKRKIKAKRASSGGHKRLKMHVLAKKSKRVKANSHVHAKASRPSSHIRPLSDYNLPAPQPSDLWLAKDCPDIYRQLATAVQPSDLTLRIIESAYRCLGVPYRRGGTTPEGFDCSGFVRYVFRENGIRLGRSSRDQAKEGKPVPLADLMPGDLIFFNMYPGRRSSQGIDHVGLYVGNGQFIHASGNRRAPEIKVENLQTQDYYPKIVEVRRVLGEEQRYSSDLGY